ncbi:30S ribosome-binding factor RbfA [bacterium]|jgi:ribosome-binding factor A|nr:30S ribosome-binding factor RbfA [bacterium]
MQATRRARLASVILEELTRLVSRELRDPRIPPVTFTSVDLTPDASQATVMLTLFGGGPLNGEEATDAEKAAHRETMAKCLKGLQSASGFLRNKLREVIDIRVTPSLIFKEDRGLENVNRVHHLLRQIQESGSSESGSSEK